jgi:hypothetical protein
MVSESSHEPPCPIIQNGSSDGYPMFSGWKMNFKIFPLLHEGSLQQSADFFCLKLIIRWTAWHFIIIANLREETENTCFMDQTMCMCNEIV